MIGLRTLGLIVFASLSLLASCSSEGSDESGSHNVIAPDPTDQGNGQFANAQPTPANDDGTAGGMALEPVGAVGGDPNTCAQGIANTSPITPTVWLVLDGSGSMDTDFEGNDTRWEALRAALMDDGGLVPTLQQGVRFGMVLYAGIDQNQGGGGLCVNLQIVEPALNNFATLDAQFPQQELGGWTPTDAAMEHVVNSLPVGGPGTSDPDAMPSPTYVILATDGAPNNHCNGNDQQSGNQNSGIDPAVAERVVTATQRGTDIGMNMFIISLAGDDNVLQTHLDEVASLTQTGTAPFVPSTRDDLVATLQQIVGHATCQIVLDGSVQAGGECTGEVRLNGGALACNSDDGFRMLDERTLQLTGSACDTFLGSSSQVVASFGCGVFTPD